MRIAQSSIGFTAKNRRDGDGMPVEIAAIAEEMAAVGWDGIEIWEPHVKDLSPAALADLAARIRVLGLQVPMLSSYYDFTTSDATCAESLANGRRVLAEARVLGARSLRIFTGKTRSRDAKPEQWTRCADALRLLCDEAAADGISLSLHVHDWNLIDTVEGTRRLIDLVGRANLLVLFKPAIYHPDHLAVLDALADRVWEVHLTASRKGPEGKAVDCGLGDSDVDHTALIAALRCHGVCEWLVLNWMGPGASAAGRAACAWLRQALRD